MADDFFKKEEEVQGEIKQEVAGEPEKIKLGDEEFTQDELNSLVGLGKIAREAEEKYNVKVEGIWPKFQQTINENVEFRKKQEEDVKVKDQEDLTTKAQTNQELTEEEQLRLASIKLRELGFVSRDDVLKEVQNVLAGKELLGKVDNLVEEQAKAGFPKTTSEDLLTYMNETGVKDPQAAYKLKFEKEIEAVKEGKLGSIKKDTFVTEESAGAGIKNPQAKPITRHNLNEALSEVLNRE